MPELMVTDDRGHVLWRVRGAVRDTTSCAWCGANTRHTWLREDEERIAQLGPACSVICAERRERRRA